MDIRPESPDDAGAVRELLLRAFDTPAEADLVDDLRARAVPFIGLVAEIDGSVAGYVAFSEVTLHPPVAGVWLALGLAPLAVGDAFRCRGVGSALVRAGVDACREAGADLVVVLGDPGYYGRFGFGPAAGLALVSGYDAPEEAFQVLALADMPAPDHASLVRFRPEFDRFA
jgi:putative acetyltransferase